MIENQQIEDDSCSACPMSECRDSRKKATGGGLSGWSFVLTSIFVFLLPLISGITGSACAGGSDTRRFIGGAIGLLGGMAVTAMSFKLFGRNQ